AERLDLDAADLVLAGAVEDHRLALHALDVIVVWVVMADRDDRTVRPAHVVPGGLVRGIHDDRCVARAHPDRGMPQPGDVHGASVPEGSRGFSEGSALILSAAGVAGEPVTDARG